MFRGGKPWGIGIRIKGAFAEPEHGIWEDGQFVKKEVTEEQKMLCKD